MKLHDNGVADFLDISEVAIADGLVAWYPLNGDAKDHTINRNDGTVYGAVPAAGVDGKLCYEFDGVDDYIDCGNTLNFGVGDFTFSIWLSRSKYVQYQMIASKGIHSAVGEWYLYNYNSDTNWNFYGNGAKRCEWTMDECFNEWAHLVVLREDDQMHIYVNGAEKTITNDTISGTNSNFTNTKKLIIGAREEGDRNWNGSISDIRIYNRALSAEEIKILYDMTGPSLATMKQSNNTVYLKGEIQETL